jgi:glycosyltransferase involved in cell wall biosynthesis
VLFVRGSLLAMQLRGDVPSTPLTRGFADRFRRADAAVFPARHMVDGVSNHGVPISVVPNAVDVEQFRPGPRDRELAGALAIAADDIVVAQVSNLKPAKRVLDLAHSAARALEQEPRLLYLVVGDGPDRRSLEEVCAECGITDRFRFAGWVDYAHVPDYVRLADLVVVPSEREGMARIYLETQATGRTLLASDIPAAREVVVDGETGLLFPIGDCDALATRTLVAAGDAALRGRIGRAARKYVEAHHALPRAVEAYEKILGDVVARASVRE